MPSRSISITAASNIALSPVPGARTSWKSIRCARSRCRRRAANAFPSSRSTRSIAGRPGLAISSTPTARRSSFGPGGGDDVFLTIADLDGQLLRDDTTVINTRILAMNRDLPARLPFGGGRPRLSTTASSTALPAFPRSPRRRPTRRPSRRRAANWKLIGQLSLNHLSLVGGMSGGQALREVLALYDVGDTPESGHLRERLVSVTSAPGVARLRLKGHTAMCAGTDVTLEIDDERLSGSGTFPALRSDRALPCRRLCAQQLRASLRQASARGWPVEDLVAANRRAAADMSDLKALARRLRGATLVQAVRMAEASARQAGNEVEVGGDSHPREEPIRLVASDRLHLVTRDIAETEAQGNQLVITSNVLGLAGATPALPPVLQRIAAAPPPGARSDLQCLPQSVRSPGAFLLLSHRAQVRWPLLAEGAARGAREPVVGLLNALGGLGSEGVRKRLDVADAALAPLVAHLGDARRTTAGVRTILQMLTGLPLRIIEACPVWISVPPGEQTRLGRCAGAIHPARQWRGRGRGNRAIRDDRSERARRPASLHRRDRPSELCRAPAILPGFRPAPAGDAALPARRGHRAAPVDPGADRGGGHSASSARQRGCAGPARLDELAWPRRAAGRDCGRTASFRSTGGPPA